MKIRIKLLFLAIVFLSSCTISKRKYMSGYSLQWKASHTSTHLRTAPSSNSNQIAASPVSPVVEEGTSNNALPFIMESTFSPKPKDIEVHEGYKKSSFPPDTAKKQPVAISVTQPVDENARKCNNNAIAAVLTGITSVFLLIIGPSLETNTVSYFVVVGSFIVLMLLCLAFAADAVSYALKAFKDFKKEPGKHSGFDIALKGLIFGIICLLYFTLIAIVFVIAAKAVF
jgi:hypothetical protein